MADEGPTAGQMRQGRLLTSESGVMTITLGIDPDLDQFTRLRTNTYRQYFADVKADEVYYRKKYGQAAIPKEWQEKGFSPTTPPTAYNAVEAAVDHILTTPDIYVPPRPIDHDFLKEDQIASNKMRFLEAWWHNVFVHGDPISAATKKVIKDGKLILKLNVDWEAVDLTGAGLGTRQFIWKLRCLPVDTVMEDPDNPEDPMYAYEAYQIRVDEAKRLFPDIPDIKAKVESWRNKKPSDRVMYCEYWRKPHGTDQGARKVWIDNEKVIDKPNPYRWRAGETASGATRYDGRLPYFIRGSGWGDTDATAMPHDRYVGLLRYMHDILETEARQLSAADGQLRITTFPTMVMYGINEDQEKKIKIQPAGKVHLTNRETQSIETLEWPKLDPSVWQIISRLHSYANELAKFEQFSGSPQRGVDTATEADQNFRNASSKLRGPVTALQTVMMAINEAILCDIEMVLEAPVTVYGASESGPGIITIEPNQIDGFYMNFVELKTTDQAALDRADARLWGDLYRILRIDRGYAGTKAGIKNMQERMAARMAEDVNDDPRMHELRVMMALAGQGEMGQQVQQAMMAALQQGQMLGGGTPPAGQTGNTLQPPSPQAALTGGGGSPMDAQAMAAALGNRPDLANQ